MSTLIQYNLCFHSPDKPSAPRDLVTSGVTESTVSLTWQTPEDDGGCEVTGYVVEMREASKRSWKPSGTTQELSLTVDQLKEGRKYYFQVAAQNEVGTGPFVELSKAAVPKSDYGKCYLLFVKAFYVKCTTSRKFEML